MRVDEARDDGLAGDIDDPGFTRHADRAALPHRLDPVVAHQQVGILDHLVAAHRDDACAAQDGDALGDIARDLDLDPRLLRLEPRSVFLFLLFFFLGRLLALRPGRHRCPDAVIEGLGGAEIVGEEGVADRPVHGPPIGAPGRELSPQLGELARREGRVVGFGDGDGGCLADVGYRHHVDLVEDLGQRPVATGSHQYERGLGRLFGVWVFWPRHLDVLFLVGAVPTERDQPVGVAIGEDPKGVAGEMRGGDALRRTDHSGRAAVGGNPNEVLRAAGDAAGQRLAEGAGRAADRHDASAVG